MYLKEGMTYKLKDGQSFSFDITKGVFIGRTNHLWPIFQLSDTQKCFMVRPDTDFVLADTASLIN